VIHPLPTGPPRRYARAVSEAPIATLERVPLLSRLDKKDLKAMAKEMSERTFPEGSEVTVAGRSGIGFFIIEAGRATVRIGDRVVNTLGPGDHFGEIALIDQGTRSADIVADTELRCYCMTAWSFRPFVRAHPDLAWALLETLVARLRESQSQAQAPAPAGLSPRLSPPRRPAGAAGPPRSPPGGGR
jgi:CRP/FNR family transcriptional regulator, cyclic AMP receptor protein